MKKIMVRADDLGFSKAINYGIYETVKNGVIRNIGFMVNMPDSLHGYELVKDYDICLGNIQMYVWENLFVILKIFQHWSMRMELLKRARCIAAQKKIL